MFMDLIPYVVSLTGNIFSHTMLKLNTSKGVIL